MTQSLLEPDTLRHPCEAAFDILLDARMDACVLYLDVTSDGSHRTDKWVVSWRYRHHTIAPVAQPDSNRVDVGEQRLDRSTTLPIPDHTVDLLVLRASALRELDEANLSILMSLSAPHLRDDGEFFVISGAPPPPDCGAPDAGVSRKPSIPGGLSGIVKDLLNTFQAGERKRTAGALRAHGFQHTEWFVAEYNASGEPTRLSLLKHQREMQQPTSLKKWFRLRSQRGVTLIRASRHTLRPSTLFSALASMRRNTDGNAAGNRGPAIIDTMLISPKEKVVVLGRQGDDRFVLRIPFTPGARAGCEQNMLALRTLQADPDLAQIVPHPLLEIDTCGRYFSGESLVPGMPLRFLPLNEATLGYAEALLHRLNPPHRLQPIRLDGETYEELVQAPITVLARLPAVRMHCEVLLTFFALSLHGSNVRLGLCHGDFSVRNIYMDGGRVSGVIDWDEGDVHGLPVLDAIGHLISRQSRRGNGLADAIASLAARRWPVDYELDFLERCYVHFNVAPDQHFALVMLYWLRVISNQARHWFAGNDEFVVRKVQPIVSLIVEQMQAASVAEPISPSS
jgi:hypothetical protein